MRHVGELFKIVMDVTGGKDGVEGGHEGDCWGIPLSAVWLVEAGRRDGIEKSTMAKQMDVVKSDAWVVQMTTVGRRIGPCGDRNDQMRRFAAICCFFTVPPTTTKTHKSQNTTTTLTPHYHPTLSKQAVEEAIESLV